MRSLLASLAARRRLLVGLQLGFVAVVLGFLGWALRDTWADAAPRLRDADASDLAIALVLLAGYYLLFVLGWQWILRALAIETTYSVALQAEMAFAREIADRVAFLDGGLVVEHGTPERIFEAPEQPRTRQFLQRIVEARRL